MGFCKWHFDAWCIGIQGRVGVVGLIVPLSRPNALLLPEHRSCSLSGRAPLTQPHLLVLKPDIVALLQPRLVNTETRFSSMSQIEFVLAPGGIWGGVTDNTHTHNIKTFIHIPAELAVISLVTVGDLSCYSHTPSSTWH